MAAIPFWASGDFEAKRWDFVWFDDDLVPGTVEPGSFRVSKSRQVDVQKGRGSDGATLKDEGFTPAKVRFSVAILNERAYAAWQTLRAKIDPHRPGATRAPLAIEHPLAHEYGVESVTILDISSSSPSRGGKMVVAFDCLQWFPGPKPAKPKGKPKPAAKPDPADEPFPPEWDFFLI